jgi:membrane-bound inhibitor of C-type lysozyme
MLRNVTGCLALSFLATSAASAQSPAPINTVRYTCDQGRSLVVQYFTGAVRAAPNGMPLPGGHVVVTQADGTTHTLQQTASGSGIRYANESQSFVFWSKGDGAFVEEGPSQTETYSNCVGQSN